jgi:hypothetical protein
MFRERVADRVRRPGSERPVLSQDFYSMLNVGSWRDPAQCRADIE